MEIVGVLSGRGLEPKRMRFVHPYADRRPGLVLLDCVRGARSGVTVEEPLVVYESPGRYTPETGRIYGGDELMLYGLAVPAPQQDYASCQVWLERC